MCAKIFGYTEEMDIASSQAFAAERLVPAGRHIRPRSSGLESSVSAGLSRDNYFGVTVCSSAVQH